MWGSLLRPTVAQSILKVTKIEGVFSGTLSYIFNEFSDGKSGDGPSFSSIVSVARQNGYTVRLRSRTRALRVTRSEWLEYDF